MKTLLLIVTILLGIIFPIGHSYAFLIKYLLMIMLFFSFLQMEVSRKDFKYNHLVLLGANIGVPVLSYLLLKPMSLQLAQAVFITAIAPTAVASPIIINILKGKIEFAVISILLTNFVIAFLLPFLLPLFLNSGSDISTLDVLFPVSEVFLIPYILALLVKKYTIKIKTELSKLNKYVFYILVININLGTSKASYYIRQEMSFSDPLIYQIAIASLILCVLFFYLGRLTGPKDLKIESSLSLGQKNNGFTVWVALTFISPLAVLGPVFYILFQNIYISWQLHNKTIE